MRRPRLPFDYHPQEQRGVLFLLLLILIIQLGYWAWGYFRPHPVFELHTSPVPRDTVVQDLPPVRPFNPNFISDYKGYMLGMSPEAIDRLHAFRASGSWVRSAEEFQEVTGVPDSLLQLLSPSFRFPSFERASREQSPVPAVRPRGDLNQVDAEALMEIRGIGPVLSARILKFRTALHGFLVDDQLYDVYGLERDVADRVLQRYQVKEVTVPKRININQATREELAALVYLSPKLASAIIRYREDTGSFENLEELKQVPGFPSGKFERIRLYLEH